jgi:hypothetical protein
VVGSELRSSRGATHTEIAIADSAPPFGSVHCVPDAASGLSLAISLKVPANGLGIVHRTKGNDMEHVRIATYEITQGTFDEVASMAKTGMLRKFETQPGFIRYGLADIGDRKCLSISLWGTRKDADAAVPVAAQWVRENLSARVELKSNVIGDLAFFEGTPVRV